MREERLRKKIEAFRAVCLAAASLSEDEKHRVGAIVFRKNFTSIPAIAYNGNYAGGPNDRDSPGSGQSGYIHAEINALIRAGLTPETAGSFALMVSLAPCKMCAKTIVNAGIRTVFVLEPHHRSVDYEPIFNSAGVRHAVLNDYLRSHPHYAHVVARAMWLDAEADEMYTAIDQKLRKEACKTNL
jgi:dCMP deaminase